MAAALTDHVHVLSLAADEVVAWSVTVVNVLDHAQLLKRCEGPQYRDGVDSRRQRRSALENFISREVGVFCLRQHATYHAAGESDAHTSGSQALDQFIL